MPTDTEDSNTIAVPPSDREGGVFLPPAALKVAAVTLMPPTVKADAETPRVKVWAVRSMEPVKAGDTLARMLVWTGGPTMVPMPSGRVTVRPGSTSDTVEVPAVLIM